VALSQNSVFFRERSLEAREFFKRIWMVMLEFFCGEAAASDRAIVKTLAETCGETTGLVLIFSSTNV